MKKEFEQQINNAIYATLQEMTTKLSLKDLRELQRVLFKNFAEVTNTEQKQLLNDDYIERYMSAKKIEGMAESTLKSYQSTIKRFLAFCDNKLIIYIDTDDVRYALNRYKETSGCSDYSLDSFRRRISAIFAWFLEEEYIVKNPVARIHKINYTKKVKKVFSDEEVERLFSQCATNRQMAIVGMLNSTGMRVGELASLKLSRVNLEEKECVVCGKGNKERTVYFDPKTKLFLEKYLEERDDDIDALFLTKIKPYRQISTRSIQREVSYVGELAAVAKCHPHKFRSTLATRAIDKGMPVEQLKELLGHTEIDTTLVYAQVQQKNIKRSHEKFIC